MNAAFETKKDLFKTLVSNQRMQDLKLKAEEKLDDLMTV